MIKKPMLACKADLEKIQFPIFAYPKIDGIRCLTINGQAVSRSFKPIRNKYIQEKMKELPDGLDGELVVGDSFDQTSSSVMSEDGEPDFKYIIFDYVASDIKEPFISRYLAYNQMQELPGFCEPLGGELFKDLESLLQYESKIVKDGYEGIMIRNPDGAYKCGRSTLREGGLLKIKRFFDEEAEIIGFEEKLENHNVLEKDELGYAKRSTKKEGMVKSGVLGAFIVKNKHIPEFRIASGLYDTLREDVWKNKDNYIGKLIKFKYQELTKDGKYRFPTFVGFRDKDDL